MSEEGEKLEFNDFLSRFKTAKCWNKDGKLICVGYLDEKPMVCELTQKEGKAEVVCRKVSETEQVSSPV